MKPAWAGAFKRENVILIHPFYLNSSAKWVGGNPLAVLAPSSSAGKIGKTLINVLRQSRKGSSEIIGWEEFLQFQCQALGVASKEEMLTGSQFVKANFGDDRIFLTPMRRGPDDFQKSGLPDVIVSGFSNHKAIGEALIKAWSFCQ